MGSIASATTMGAVGLIVADLNRSLAFYTGALGLHVQRRTPQQAWLGADGPTLLVLTEQPGAKPVQRGHTGLYHVAYLLPSRTDLARTLRHLIETDEGAARLGEVALVAHSSPISQSGILFYNTLFDENAADHIALGRAYKQCLQGGPQMNDEAFNAAGGNLSLTHNDFMIGSAEIDVDGVLADGRRQPVMRQGEWAF